MMTKKLLLALLCLPVASIGQTIPSGASIDAQVKKVMSSTHANGMAVAVVDKGKVGYVQAYGVRNAKGDPLTIDTVMYGASITKTVLAYTTMQLVDQGKLSLDTPIKDDLDHPLTAYGPDPVFPDKHGPYPDLAGDPRWEKITPRMCLTHSTGFNNFWFIEPDQKLHIHFEPGTRYSYSGEGFILLQFVIEHGRKAQGLGLDVGDLTKANFDRLGMTRTSLVKEQRKDLAAGLGVVVFDGPQGHGFHKGGHDGQTANTMVCIEASRRCVVILSNDVRAEAGFADLVRFILGDTGVPYDWEYGDFAGKS
jgi:CubicO group peptidase (beta-lactamase class C family)